jgi:hypothetical protein
MEISYFWKIRMNLLSALCKAKGHKVLHGILYLR